MSKQERVTSQVDWEKWVMRWDAMQGAYLPYREERFTIMLDVVAQVVGETFLALDLACGPGAISQRLLMRFPQARRVALDYDPALLALGQGALGAFSGRLRWVEADLHDPTWIGRLGETQFDAVRSTTALHWLDAGALTRTGAPGGRPSRASRVSSRWSPSASDALPASPRGATARTWRASRKGIEQRRLSRSTGPHPSASCTKRRCATPDSVR